MDKNAAASLDALDKKIESLLAKKEIVLKKERERKARAQEKWKGIFQKEVIKGITAVYGADYEEILSPEECAADITRLLKTERKQEAPEEPVQEAGKENPAPAASAEKIDGKGETDDE